MQVLNFFKILGCYNRIRESLTINMDFQRHKKFLEVFGKLTRYTFLIIFTLLLLSVYMYHYQKYNKY